MKTQSRFSKICSYGWHMIIICVEYHFDAFSYFLEIWVEQNYNSIVNSIIYLFISLDFSNQTIWIKGQCVRGTHLLKRHITILQYFRSILRYTALMSSNPVALFFHNVTKLTMNIQHQFFYTDYSICQPQHCCRECYLYSNYITEAKLEPFLSGLWYQ